MTQSVFIFSFVFVVTIYASAAKLQCGPLEVEVSCPSECEVDRCPKRENYDRSCHKPDKCPSATCKCRFNYSRMTNGTCIPTRDCPPFECKDPNAVYTPCPPYCPTDDCSQATSDGECPLIGRIGIVVQCQPACRCNKGYWKNKGVCVPYEQCPNKPQSKSLAQLLGILQ